MIVEKWPTERQEQIAFVRWFRYAYRGVRIFAIPNGACTNPVAGRRFREEGRESGVPDLYIPAWNLWIEMKRGNWREAKNPKEGSTAFNQKDWHRYLREECGHTVLVCKGCNDAIEQVKKWGDNHGYGKANHNISASRSS